MRAACSCGRFVHSTDALVHAAAPLACACACRLQLRPFVVAQRYLHDPLLINGRKFGLRLWAVVTSAKPLRVWLHCNGLVLFSNSVSEAWVGGPRATGCATRS